MSIDTKSLRKYIDKHGPPLSPMLIFTLLDEIERQQPVVDAARTWAEEHRTGSHEIHAAARLWDAVQALDNGTKCVEGVCDCTHTNHTPWCCPDGTCR